MNSKPEKAAVSRWGWHTAALGAVLCLLSSSYSNAGSNAPSKPVIVGAGPTEDACGTVGIVSGLNPAGSNILSVRSGPGTHHQRVDFVPTAQVLFICGQEGPWHAVVYTNTDADCGVSTPVDPAIPYGGPCKSGWVFGDFVELIAG